MLRAMTTPTLLAVVAVVVVAAVVVTGARAQPAAAVDGAKLQEMMASMRKMKDGLADDAESPPLTGANFDTVLRARPAAVVMFHSTPSRAFARFNREFEKVANLLQDRVFFAKVDVDAERALVARLRASDDNNADNNNADNVAAAATAADGDEQQQRRRLSSLPDVSGGVGVAFYAHGVARAHLASSSLDIGSFIQFVQRQISPAVTPVHSPKELVAFRKSAPYAIVGFFPDADTPAHAHFRRVAADDTLSDDYRFGEVVGATALAAFGAPGDSVTVTLFRGQETLVYERDGDSDASRTLATLRTWLLDSTTPMFEEIGTRAFRRMRSELPLSVLFFDKSAMTPAEHARTLAAGRAAAATLLGAVASGYGDGRVNRLQFDSMAGAGHSLPALVIEHPSTGRRYVRELASAAEAGDADALVAWTRSVLRGDVEPSLRSAPAPAQPLGEAAGSVFPLVGSAWSRVVPDLSHDVFVMFHAPWCSHCRNIEPSYARLATELAETHPRVRLAKIDGSQNDHPESQNVRVYPLFKFYPCNNKDGIWFSGRREYDVMREFLQRYSCTDEQARDVAIAAATAARPEHAAAAAEQRQRVDATPRAANADAEALDTEELKEMQTAGFA